MNSFLQRANRGTPVYDTVLVPLDGSQLRRRRDTNRGVALAGHLVRPTGRLTEADQSVRPASVARGHMLADHPGLRARLGHHHE